MDSGSQQVAHIPQANNMEDIFIGLQDKCPLIIDKKVQLLLNYFKFPSVVAISISDWKYENLWSCGQRVSKYAVKRAMDCKLFETLIWVTKPNRRNDSLSSRKKFQLRVAETLALLVFPPPPPIASDDDDDDDYDEGVVSDRIRACLENRSFLLVHDAHWELQDLEIMGIPIFNRRGNSSKVVALSSTNLSYYIHFPIEDMDRLSYEEKLDLILEESGDIAYSPNLRGLITPEVVMDCILYFLLFDSKDIEIQILLRYWNAEGFLGADEDLEASFKLGKALLEEFHQHGLIQLQLQDVLFEPLWRFLDDHIRRNSPRFLIIYSNTLSTGVDPPQWEDIERINFYYTPDEYPMSPPKCSKLSTLVVSNFPDFKKFSENFLEHMESVRVLGLMNTSISSLPSSFPCLGTSLKILNLRNCSQLRHLQVSYLRALSKLEVLDLSKTPLEEIPEESFEGLQSLRLLDLSQCSRLSSLPSSISCLNNLEQLLLQGCTNLMVLPSSAPPLEKLLLLDLSYAYFTQIPEQFFQHMHKLQDLNLSFAHKLTSLPASIPRLINLKKLNLESCSNLRTVVPSLLQISSSLEQLDLSNCTSLEDLNKDVSSSFGRILPKIKVLGISQTLSDRFFSLKGSPCLVTITLVKNSNLEVLDLSYTKINRFPLEGSSNLDPLRRLNLLGVKHIQTVNWEEIRWLPRELNWDQCGDGTAFHLHFPQTKWNGDGNNNGIFISVSNASIFQSLTPSSNLWEKYFLRFSVYICPCIERGKRQKVPSQRTRSCYKYIYDSRTKYSTPYYERSMEIERIKRYPKSISGILSHTQFFSLHDESSVKKLSNLDIENMVELKECRFEKCYAMEVIFDVQAGDKAKYQPLLRCLEILWISKLMKLTNVCVSMGILERGSFGILKNLHLEYCPRIVNVFSSGVCLESLEVLEIKFCGRLQEVFSGEANGESSLQKLHTLCLWELPNLKSIVRDVSLTSLNRAKVKGCPKLRKIPILSSSSNINNNNLEVTGESEWWEQLQWEDRNVMHKVCFKRLHSTRFPKPT